MEARRFPVLALVGASSEGQSTRIGDGAEVEAVSPVCLTRAAIPEKDRRGLGGGGSEGVVKERPGLVPITAAVIFAIVFQLNHPRRESAYDSFKVKTIPL